MAKHIMRWVVEADLIQGDDKGTLNSTVTAARAAAAAMLQQVMPYTAK